jgi:hypothetical protein
MQAGGVHGLNAHLQLYRGGIVDECCDAAQFVIGVFKQAYHILLGADVGLYSNGLSILLLNGADQLVRFFLTLEIVDADGVSAPGREKGSSSANATTAASDD